MSDPSALDEFIQLCRELVVAPDAVSNIRSAMEEFLGTEGLAERHPAPTDCTAISGLSVQHFEDETISVQMVHTPPDIAQPPHDHQMSVVIGGISGVEMHRLYRRTPNEAAPITLTGTKDLSAGDVMTIGAQGVHAINAAAPQWATALHVYLGSLSTVDRSLFHPDTIAEEPLDLERYDDYCR